MSIDGMRKVDMSQQYVDCYHSGEMTDFGCAVANYAMQSEQGEMCGIREPYGLVYHNYSR